MSLLSGKSQETRVPLVSWQGHQKYLDLIVFLDTREITLHTMLPQPSPIALKDLLFWLVTGVLESKVIDVFGGAKISFPSLSHIPIVCKELSVGPSLPEGWSEWSTSFSWHLHLLCFRLNFRLPKETLWSVETTLTLRLCSPGVQSESTQRRMLSGIGGFVLGLIFLGLGLIIRLRNQKGNALWRNGGVGGG